LAALAVAALIGAQLVFAEPPTASFSIDPPSPAVNQTVTFTSSVQDPDGDGTAGGIEWDFTYDGTSFTQDATGASASTSYSTGGPRTVAMRVTDGTVSDGTADTVLVTQALTVTNQPPTASFTISDTVPEVGQVVNFDGGASSDPEGQPLTYAWDLDGDGEFNDGNGPTASRSFSSGGERTVRLRVTDAGNESHTATRTLRVNVPPTPSFDFSPPNPNPNQQILFTSSSSDAEGPVTLAWDLDNDGAFDDGSDTSESWSFPTGGDKTVRLRATDSDGAVRETSRTVPVFLNSPPVANFNFTGTNPVTPDVPDVGEPINFTSTSTDPDGDQTIVDWDWDLDNDGAFDDGSGATRQHSFPTSGNKTVGLRVTDSSGATHSTTRMVRVNALPIARPSSLNPQTESGQKYNVPLINQPILFTGRSTPQLPGASPAPGCPASAPSPGSAGSTDPDNAADGNPTAITKYEWDLDGTPGFETDRGADPDFPHAGFPAAGDRTAVLRVTDSDGATAEATLPFRVNTAPTAQFVFEPFTPIIGEEIAFGSTSGDPDAADGGQLIHSWDLDGDGTFCETGETGASVKHTFTTANTYPVKLRVTDTGGITREVTRDVLVQNTIPTGGISFSPDAPLPDEPVTFTGSASSPTGKAIGSMQWDFSFDQSGQFDVEATGASVSRAFSSPGPKRVALRIEEVGGGFAIVTTTVNVNAPPQARFSVAPEDAFVGDIVTLSSTSVDPDGPLARQEWDLDNDGQFDDANAAVVSARFNSEGTHPLKLRVTDSRGATSTATGQVIVRTRPVPPPPPTPLLNGVIISGRFLLFRSHTKVRFLRVRAPAGSMIRVRCSGRKKCPKRLTRKQLTKRLKKAQRVQFKALQRRFRPGAKLTITVTKSGFIGRQTTFKLRRRKPPVRRDLCLPPGAKKATACPSG
jgi:PKD repeat protein